MTLIIFHNAQLHDTQAPARTLTLQAGRGGDPERFFLSNGSKSVYLDREQAAEFLGALAKIDRCVRARKLEDRVFYSGEIHSYDGKTLGVDLGIKVGRPSIAIEDTRIDVSPDDLAYFAAACSQAHYLCGGIGIASRIARARPGPRPIWEGYSARFLNNGERPWYADD